MLARTPGEKWISCWTVRALDVSQTEPLPGTEPVPLTSPVRPIEAASHADLIALAEERAPKLRYRVQVCKLPEHRLGAEWEPEHFEISLRYCAALRSRMAPHPGFQRAPARSPVVVRDEFLLRHGKRATGGRESRRSPLSG
jgi:hypothetical protein